MNRYKLLIILLAICIFAFSTQTISKENDENFINLSLEEMLNTPISSAAKYEQKVSNAPASITIITEDDIKRYGYKTLFDALQSVKGFFGRDNRNYYEMGVRGIDRPSDYGNKILLLLNGHTYNDNFYGAAVYGNDFGIDMDIIDRIEIVFGPSSALYGTGAMVAVINVITKNGKNLDRFSVKAELGNINQRNINLSWGDMMNNDFDFLINAKYGISDGENIYVKEFDSLKYNNGIAENLDGEEFFSTFIQLNYKNLTLNKLLPIICTINNNK